MTVEGYCVIDERECGLYVWALYLENMIIIILSLK